MNTVIL